MGFLSLAALAQAHALHHAERVARIIRATFPRPRQVTMLAIADTESDFRCRVARPPFRGLFQVDAPLWAPRYPASLWACAANARVARHILATQGLTAWQSYTTGAYRADLPVARQLLARVARPASPVGERRASHVVWHGDRAGLRAGRGGGRGGGRRPDGLAGRETWIG